MHALEKYSVSPEEYDLLRRQLLATEEITPFRAVPHLAARVAALGIQREVGTLNDEMARFVFDAETHTVVPRASLRAELVQYRREIGVRIWAEGFPRLELKFRGIHELMHPEFSFNDDGTVAQCVVFPVSVAKIMELEGVETALIRPWALNTVFGGFHPSTHYYQTNLWELKNNDTVRFSTLVQNRQVPFLGTHDLVAHISGTKGAAWETLAKRGAYVRELLEDYFDEISVPTITSLVLPYTAGVLLDDLAQPPSYDDPTRIIPLDLVTKAIERRAIRPEEPRVLLKFPEHYAKVIDLARFHRVKEVTEQAPRFVKELVGELVRHSALIA